MTCTQCGSQISETARFCPSCGSAVDIGATPTLAPESPAATVRTPVSGAGSTRRVDSSASTLISSSSDSFDGARFVPGTVLADRYRIVAMAGRGGMGEVYRADDLKLSQTVALKFLPESLAQDGAAQARFHREVRIARQIAHPNVCRVFDIGEAGGLPFLTMEYVDGEDLGTLLRRIGRLPSDKAIEITRQVCAGLAAAHDHGVIHRDLKPGNVMIDGRGKVRLTDFGLAGVAGEFRPEESRAGTPAYMAPEQLAGQEPSVRSDIYALGLVMYEVFTGKRAFDAATMADLRRMHDRSAPTNPTLLVKDIDPVVERVILRCLEKDPERRPASALQVAAALPGGDPLAAALAAGETPSPEMIAAAGATEGLARWIVAACVAFVAIGLVVLVLTADRTTETGVVPLPYSGDVLAAKAHELVQQLGYTAPPVDRGFGFAPNTLYVSYLSQKDKSATRWNALANGMPPGIRFWYRESPRLLDPRDFIGPNLGGGRVTSQDPPTDISGMTEVILGTDGKLSYFEATPPQVDQSTSVTMAPDWRMLFGAAGLDMAAFKSSPPQWNPPQFADARAAWEGATPGHPDWPLRIEAAAYRGRPVYFSEVYPWTYPGRMQRYQPTTQEKIASSVESSVLISVLVASIVAARRSLKAGRANRQGAFHLATFTFATFMATWVLETNHVNSGYEFWLFVMAVSWALCAGVAVWVLYVALEPLLRRYWPDTLLSWSRVLTGRFRDPMVGRDCLFGVAIAVLLQLLHVARALLEKLFHQPPHPPATPDFDVLLGIRFAVGDFLGNFPLNIFLALGITFAYLLLRTIVRKEWLATPAFIILFSLPSLFGERPAIDFIIAAMSSVVFLATMRYLGVVALSLGLFVNYLLQNFPLTTNFSAWYSGAGLFALTVAAALTVYGAHTALAGKSIWGTNSLES